MGTASWVLIIALAAIAVLAGIAVRIWTTNRGIARAEAERLRANEAWEAEARAAELRRQRMAAAREKLAVLRQAVAGLNKSEYLAASDIELWRHQHGAALNFAHEPQVADDLPALEADEFRTCCSLLFADPDAVGSLNHAFVARRLTEEQVAFDGVEAYPLTDRQRTAIVTDEDTTLVIAGAGTGKTSVIIGKVDYLVRRRLALPPQILALAFARKASEELQERLDRFGAAAAADVSTFHALGLRIVGEVDGTRPSLSKLAEDDRELKLLIRDSVAKMLADPQGRELLVRFLTTLADDESAEPAGNGDQYIRQEQIRGLRALDGTKVKSGEEKQIANWFILNGIDWKYERPYPFPTATPWKRTYQPDFYLPRYDLYLEHFGVDRQNRTAPYVNTENYLRAMAWKRQLHQHQGTKLIETFSWMSKEGGLIPHLEAQLAPFGVERRPLSVNDIAAIVHEENRPFSDFVSLLAQFLAVFKGAGANRSLSEGRARSERDSAFLAIFWRVYDEYEQRLAERGEIDFNDMINRAREYVQAGRFHSPYRYMLVDEFQDISENRIGLLEDLRRQQPGCRLFVVGDDWQSIYRFNGSDVGIITHLPERVGRTERVDLDIAFRYPQEMVDVTSQFVNTNPAQLTKTVTSFHGNQNTAPICVIFETTGPAADDGDPTASRPGLPPAIERAFFDITARSGGAPVRVFILGRYRFNMPPDLDVLTRLAKRSKIALEYMTVHASKGKEADYVIVVGLNASEYGFPSRISDDPVMQLVLTDAEKFQYAEERRLFYVAMTRARKRVYLIAPDINASPFVGEDLMSDRFIPYVAVIGEASKLHVCPTCGGKTIRRREGQYGTFWACEHYPLCHGKLDACPTCKDGGIELVANHHGPSFSRCTLCGFAPEQCPRCQRGILLRRNGQHGSFLGCSRYDDGAGCRYTRDSANSGDEATV